MSIDSFLGFVNGVDWADDWDEEDEVDVNLTISLGSNLLNGVGGVKFIKSISVNNDKIKVNVWPANKATKLEISQLNCSVLK